MNRETTPVPNQPEKDSSDYLDDPSPYPDTTPQGSPNPGLKLPKIENQGPPVVEGVPSM